MYYVYVLQSKKDDKFYTGFTTDLGRRIDEHNKGQQISTQHRIPFHLIYYEWCLNKDDVSNGAWLSLARALEWGSRGHRFKSCRPD